MQTCKEATSPDWDMWHVCNKTWTLPYAVSHQQQLFLTIHVFCSLKDSASHSRTPDTFTATEPAVLNTRRIFRAGYQECWNNTAAVSLALQPLLLQRNQTKQRGSLHFLPPLYRQGFEQTHKEPNWRRDHQKASHQRQVIFIQISSPA